MLFVPVFTLNSNFAASRAARFIRFIRYTLYTLYELKNVDTQYGSQQTAHCSLAVPQHSHVCVEAGQLQRELAILVGPDEGQWLAIAAVDQHASGRRPAAPASGGG